jgi:hypothetical protein
MISKYYITLFTYTIKGFLIYLNHGVMENLTFKHTGQLVSKRITGGIVIIIAMVLLIFKKDSLTLFDWLESILFFFLGVIYFTPLSGSDVSFIESGEGNIKIRWRSWFREVMIQDTEIEKITLAKTNVLISRKGKKPVRMAIDTLEKEQKTKVYEFMIEYARQRNLILER